MSDDKRLPVFNQIFTVAYPDSIRRLSWNRMCYGFLVDGWLSVVTHFMPPSDLYSCCFCQLQVSVVAPLSFKLCYESLAIVILNFQTSASEVEKEKLTILRLALARNLARSIAQEDSV